jgi:hypothetical protein
MVINQQFSDFDSGIAKARLEHLRQQERVWFAWVCRLHDVHSGAGSPHSAAVLAVAQRRWAEARRALQREAQQRLAERPQRPPPRPSAS